MSDSHAEDDGDLQGFRELYARAQQHQITGDASLDVLLHVLEPEFAALIQELSLAHWFDVRCISALLSENDQTPSEQYLNELVEFPFVRKHERGYQYHDAVRAALRTSLIKRDPSLVRRSSGRIAASLMLDGPGQLDSATSFERAYLLLAADEDQGLADLQIQFMSSLTTRQYAACDTLLHMAVEQEPLLSPAARALIQFDRGLLAFALHDWSAAEAHFFGLDLSLLADDTATEARIYRGRTLEAQGRLREAERQYLHVPERNGHSAERWQRLASVALGQGHLNSAEKHANVALSSAVASDNQMVAARSLEILGRTFERLRDFDQAEKSYRRSLDLLKASNGAFEMARVYVGLGDLYASRRAFGDALAQYELAVQVKVSAGDNFGLAAVYDKLGQLYVMQGQHVTGIRYLREAASLFLHFRDSGRSAEMLLKVAVAHEHAGELDHAIESLKEAETLLTPADPRRREIKRHQRRIRRVLRWLRRPVWQRILIIVGMWLLVGVVFILVIVALSRLPYHA